MFARAIHLLGLIATGGLCSAAVVSSTPAHRWPRALSVHEWGTFTTVAGENGAAVDWLPLGGPADLPCFVEHFQDRRTVKVVPAPGAVPLDYQAARAALLGKVRMETPVLYVYAPHDTTLDVRVRFPRGLMTEWYPHAAVTQTVAGPNTLRTPSQASAIEWQDVRVRPRARASSFPTGEGDSHYYAARATDASPVTVNGQTEKFLFYRGIADFDAPITAAAIASGRVRVTNVSGTDVPALVLFERRGAKLGYRVMGSLRGETTVNAPVLDGSIGALHSHLEAILVAAGLFPKEAAAMVDTWRESWFEDGTRVFYIVPPSVVDAVLPLEIRPAPDHIARVFVGRMEILDTATVRSVERAITANDARSLERYGRFLGPIADRLMTSAPNAAERARIRSAANAALTAYLKRSAGCE